MDARGELPPLPELEFGEYLIDELFAFGPYRKGAMGDIQAKDWVDVWAFHKATGRLIHEWERELVLKMSRDYVEGLNIGLSPLGIPPYGAGKIATVGPRLKKPQP